MEGEETLLMDNEPATITTQMKLVVPHTMAMRPIVREVLEDIYRLDPEFVFMESNESYHYLMERLWHEREKVVVVEHDVLPWPGAVEELYACPYPWCSCSYKITLTRTGESGYGIYHTFGCTKFSTHLMDQLPDVWSQVDSRFWRHLDAQFSLKALAVGQIPHPHRPPVIHLKP